MSIELTIFLAFLLLYSCMIIVFAVEKIKTAREIQRRRARVRELIEAIYKNEEIRYRNAFFLTNEKGKKCIFDE